ncbi:MAG: adenosylcobinamide-GDP ribazoletransferase, partial [Steroidobacteraceae bacterium]
MRNLILAIQFLTRLPTPKLHDFEQRELAHAAAWFPVVGTLVGALITALALLGNQLDSGLGALLALLMWVWVTGALHLDGLADFSDALGAAHGDVMGAAHRDPQRLMQVMHDPHLGSFGVIALITALLSKLVLLRVNLDHAALSIWTLPLICAWARTGAIAWSAYLPALSDSSTERFSWDIDKQALMWNVSLLLILSAQLAPPLLLAPVVLLSWGWVLQRRLGGVSGDCLGAGVELT